MNLNRYIQRLTNNSDTIYKLLVDVSTEQAQYKPNSDSWSMLEVINHLYDEEREDFRTRLNHILLGIDGEPPAIDPAGWVISRKYGERDFVSSLSLN